MHTFLPNVTHVIGSDEAGYGTLAGSLFVVGVLAPVQWQGPPGLNDSKKLSPQVLRNLFGYLRDHVVFHVVEYTPEQIDTKGVGRCLREGHRVVHSHLRARTADGMNVASIADGNLSFPEEEAIVSLPKADTLIRAVMAASVLAKGFQLAQMAAHDTVWPFYGFRDHAGYPSPRHLAELERSGPTPIHRRSYAPVARAVKSGV